DRLAWPRRMRNLLRIAAVRRAHRLSQTGRALGQGDGDRRGLTGGDPVDRLGQCDVSVGDTPGVVARQPEIDPIPDACELGMVVCLLGVESDAREEAERLAEILELEGAGECLAALLECPAVGSVHLRFSCPTQVDCA